ncbi:hypothetical protein A3B56_01175 [Candidatus Roizmanbacteria bacterium RIFCSPLOWO2_01_FULL_45_11]|uniref:SH3b domain-containing protein n=1 Tax=Candidatus Roizmanbacteria bacterium RIFCSPLOWO2_01_FULL_45_11 TaxID=1802070 RepID=A0A1F7JIQ1_9BACT|nr:MAG: hypothetical protein A3B56_01175 [Candidatus Roizmanbacteria bacterium RIFCSPLOWO2_01_FULL_45_11]
MKKILLALTGIVIIGVGLFLGRDYLPKFTSGDGELRVESSPKTTVFVNGENKGQTPLVQSMSQGKYDIKLLPENEQSTASWQQQVTLNPGVQTFVNVNLASTDASSSWEMITLEEGKAGNSEISIFSYTDPAEIFFDDERKGTTPLSFQDVSAGTHNVRLLAPGHAENTIKVTMTPGYKLLLTAQLPRTDAPSTESPENNTDGQAEGQSTTKESVTILDTPTGWLRVRSEPSTSGEEVARVDPETSYPLVDEQSGWYQIEYETGKEGWISAQYASIDTEK